MKALKLKKKLPRQQPTHPPEIDIIIDAIRDKKGEHITTIDLRNIGDAVCDFFVICDATSTTQVKAIAEGVEEKTTKKLREKPWHVEGIEHQEWILLDYVNIVVHVFLDEVRNFYRLEELWSDGIIEEHND
ncbi:MAG TPA: ribosome silencing factor [Chitinophagales bacterium]|nr:ribosome silencing factor [Chitinophagales bacterium]